MKTLILKILFAVTFQLFLCFIVWKREPTLVMWKFCLLWLMFLVLCRAGQMANEGLENLGGPG